jgi:hypothetical protein
MFTLYRWTNLVTCTASSVFAMGYAISGVLAPPRVADSRVPGILAVLRSCLAASFTLYGATKIVASAIDGNPESGSIKPPHALRELFQTSPVIAVPPLSQFQPLRLPPRPPSAVLLFVCRRTGSGYDPARGHMSPDAATTSRISSQPTAGSASRSGTSR